MTHSKKMESENGETSPSQHNVMCEQGRIGEKPLPNFWVEFLQMHTLSHMQFLPRIRLQQKITSVV